MTGLREATAIILASQARQRCICLEDDTPSCQCQVPITREQIERLRAFLLLRPDWAVAYSELADEWVAARHASLPLSQDPIGAWLDEPFNEVISEKADRTPGF
jgi:hypothetical protein